MNKNHSARWMATLALLFSISSLLHAQWCAPANQWVSKGTITPTLNRQTVSFSNSPPSPPINGKAYYAFRAFPNYSYYFDLCSTTGLTLNRLQIYDGLPATGHLQASSIEGNGAGVCYATGTPAGTSHPGTNGSIKWIAPSTLPASGQMCYVAIFFVNCVGSLTAGPYILGYYYQPGVCSGINFFDTGGGSVSHFIAEDWTYNVPTPIRGGLVQVSFSSFSIGTGASLSIYRGNSTAAADMVAGSPFTGTTSPGTIVSDVTGMHDGSLTFKFTSTTVTSSTAAGWNATLSVITSGAVAQPGNFDVTTDKSPDKVCKGQTGVIYAVEPATGATSYIWSYSGTGATIRGTSTSATVDFAATATGGTLSVVATNGCEISAARTMAITVSAIPAQPDAFTSAPTPVCPGVAHTYSVPPVADATSYTWTLPTGWAGTSTTNSIDATPGATGDISVTADNLCGSSAPRTVHVVVHPAPDCNICPIPATVCAGDVITLTASGGVSYVWGDGQTTASINVSPTTSSTVVVEVTDANGCKASCSRTITVTPAPVCSISATVSVMCLGGSTTLTATGGTSYAWSSGQTTAAITVTPIATTTYIVTVTDANGCTSTCSKTITINRPPVCSISPVSPSITSGGSVTLTASGGVTYRWDGGQTTAAITVSPSASTMYTVTVTDANGCTSVCSRTVMVTNSGPGEETLPDPENCIVINGRYVCFFPVIDICKVLHFPCPLCRMDFCGYNVFWKFKADWLKQVSLVSAIKPDKNARVISTAELKDKSFTISAPQNIKLEKDETLWIRVEADQKPAKAQVKVKIENKGMAINKPAGK